MNVKPLSHQGGVLTVIPRRPKKMQNARCAQYERMHHRSNAVASPLDAVGSHRTQSDGAHFEHTQNKHRHPAFARRPNRAQRGHRKVTIAAQYGLLQRNRSSAGKHSAHRGRRANALVVRDCARRLLGVHATVCMLSG